MTEQTGDDLDAAVTLSSAAPLDATQDTDVASTSSRRSMRLRPKDLIRKLRISKLGHGPCSPTVDAQAALRRHKGHDQVTADETASDSSSDSASSRSSYRSSKLSNVGDNSTRKTSIDSRFSYWTKDTVNRSGSRRKPLTKSSPETGALGTIDEAAPVCVRPTVVTVEKAAAAKIHLETHFNEVLHKPCARETRRQSLESQLHLSSHLNPQQKNAVRAAFFEQETWHLRERRVLDYQSQAAAGGRRADIPLLSRYEPVKVLGRGSFGVVRLVRERANPGYGLPKQVFAMKVIRKSAMLRSSQEGHLRAERDFLTASEGSKWFV